MAKKSTARAVSKKHLARLERERRQTRAIIYGSIAIIALILGAIIYSILDQTVIRAAKPVVTVNGDVARVGEFQTQTKLYRLELINQYKNVYIMAQMFGIDPNSDDYINSLYSQVNSALGDPQSLGQTVLNKLIEIRLVRQYAAEHGITVTDDEVELAIQEAFQYFPNGSPTPTQTSTPLVYPTFSATQFALVTPTPTFTPSPTPEASPTPTATPSAEPTATATLVPTLAPTAFTEQAYKDAYKEYLKTYDIIKLSSTDYRNTYFRDRLLREKVYKVITKDVPHEQEMVWARHILVADESTAKQVLFILNSGVSFSTLASHYSLDTTNKDSGGDLGWFKYDAMVAPFSAAAFSMEVGATSQPIQTEFGWHIIQVIGHEIRPLTADEYQAATDAAFDDWVTAQREASDIVLVDNWLEYVSNTPTLQEVMLELIYSQQTSAVQQGQP
jgi:peptidyl-prolyl cis-trans isomerase D